MVVLDIILWDGAVVLDSFFGGKVRRVGLLQQASPMYFSLRRILLMVLVCHTWLPYHEHGRAASLRQAIRQIIEHDAWQLEGRSQK